jgi:valyl-tRNA synthetase
MRQSRCATLDETTFHVVLFCISTQRTRAGELVITPKLSENEWYRWLENIQDWCISRQLWWGHRVPAYFVRIQEIEQNVCFLHQDARYPNGADICCIEYR